MTSHTAFSTAFRFAAIGVCSIALSRLDAARPNIVLILADDLGFSDLGCYGGEIKTPQLDKLAQQGLRFSQFYNAARCCPTRASLLTGLYPHQAGIGHMTYDAGEPGYRGDLSKQAVTIAEVLKTAGYQTMMCGKWHVTPNTKPATDSGNWPRQRGFDRFFGTLPGHGSFWDPAGLMRGNTFIEPDRDFFYTDAIAENAAGYIRDAAKVDKPFFLYVAFTAPHYPLHARAKTIAKYDGVYDDGWDVVRRRRYERLVRLGLIERGTKLPPRDEASIPWEDDPHQAWQAHRMQVYAAMVDEMDQGIGRILDALDATREADNTLIVFLSDNGGSCEGHRDNKIERLDKPWVSSVIPKAAPDGSPVVSGDFPNLRLGPASTYGSYGVRWASVSNTPFRRHKSWVHEGGIAAPCIVHWPENLPKAGTICHDVAHIIDLMPTFVELAEAKVPSNRDGRDVPALQGQSLMPLLGGKPISRDYLCWEHEGNRAIRQGRWKLVSEYPGTWSSFYPYAKQGRWELYDMAEDRTELNDLAQQRPKLVARLSGLYERWAKRSQVVDWDELEGKQP